MNRSSRTIKYPQSLPDRPQNDWARLLRCTECADRNADFVVSGANRVGCFKTAHLF